MTMNDLDLSALLGGASPSADAQLEAMRRFGMLGQLSGDKVLAPAGQQMINQAQQQDQAARQRAGDALRAAADRQRQAQEASRFSLDLRKASELERHNREAERISAARPPATSPLQIVMGEGGAQFFVDPRNPAAPAVPVTGPDGKPITKPKATRPLQTADKKIIDDLTGEVRAVDTLSQRFKDSFAGGGPAGGWSTALYQKLGSAGTKNMQEDAAFWADFSRLIDLPQRNAVFGASLSEGEKTSWEGAKNIKPGSDPALVRQKLAEMSDIMKRKLGNIGDSLSEEGYDREAIVKRTGGVYGADASPAAPVAVTRKFTRVNGKLVEVK